MKGAYHKIFTPGAKTSSCDSVLVYFRIRYSNVVKEFRNFPRPSRHIQLPELSMNKIQNPDIY
jgi:hypothetical protein